MVEEDYSGDAPALPPLTDAQWCTLLTSDCYTKPLPQGAPAVSPWAPGRGLHSSTLWLNVSALCGIGGACWGCRGGVYGVIGGIRGCLGCVLCQKRLRLS
jgi:hypothetical protein